MDLMSLAARLTLDMRDYEEAIGKAKESAQSFSEKFSGSISKIGGAVTTVAKAGAAAIGAGSAAVGMLTKQSVSAYSEYEQLSGGVKKLFGDAASDVEKYASQAYKTAGMSANQYMEQATSFSASLINSLGGDTKKAAELADVAMRAMSDNVNTFGTDMSSVQYAFQGFAKQNYTMLDNLKLGYGGTKQEMQRLIDDANAYAAANGQAANMSMESFADIIRAIELIQEKQGIAGTTAKEAATTIEGAFNSTKAAWDNLVAGLANPDANLGQLIDNLIVAVVGDKEGEGLLNQLMPAIERALDGIGQLISRAAPIISKYLPGLMEAILPGLISAATSLVVGLVKALPSIIQILVKSIYDVLVEEIPQIKPALDLLITIFEGAFNVISGIANFMINHIEQIKLVVVAAAGAIAGLGIVGLIGSIAGAITTVVSAMSGLIAALGMIKSFAGLVSVITTLAGGPLVLIPVLIGALVAAFIYLWNTSEGFRKFWITLWNGIKTAANVAIKFVIDQFLGMANAVKTIIDIWITIHKTINNIFNAIAESITNIIVYIYEAGKQIISGLWNGIVDRWNSFVSDFRNLGTNFVNMVKSIFRIASPSGVFADIGDYLMQGLSKGIRNGVKGVNSAMETVRDALVIDDDPNDDFPWNPRNSGSGGSTLPPLINTSKNSENNGQITVVMEMDGEVWGRGVYRLNKQQEQRVGLKLVTETV